MTIAISLKVNDGLVLAADSASTMILQDPATGNTGVSNVYNNANKVYCLHKELPIGAITWGSGSIGPSSIATLAKDFRKLITEEDSYIVDPENYTVEEIAHKFYKFMYVDSYLPIFTTWPQKPALGFMVAGYSAKANMAEEWIIEIENGTGNCQGPKLRRGELETGVTWNGEPEALTRLLCGFGTGLPTILQGCGYLDQQQIIDIITQCRVSLQAPVVIPPMPIQDAIDLAEFLVETTINFSRFIPGPPTVGGPIEIAAITKHEGFKWVRRKHYYNVEYNPNEGR